jgi:hypothetical protein
MSLHCAVGLCGQALAHSNYLRGVCATARHRVPHQEAFCGAAASCFAMNPGKLRTYAAPADARLSRSEGRESGGESLLDDFSISEIWARSVQRPVAFPRRPVRTHSEIRHQGRSETSQRETSKLNTETVLNNADLQAWGYRTQATGYEAQSQLDEAQAQQAPIGADLAASGGFLSSASALGLKWSQLGSTPTPPPPDPYATATATSFGPEG